MDKTRVTKYDEDWITRYDKLQYIKYLDNIIITICSHVLLHETISDKLWPKVYKR